MNKDKTRIIIGGGASGLVCAIVSAQNYDVTIIETSARVGKKLSQTGNGRCNILNARLDGSVYSNQKLYEIISSHCPLDKTIDFLASCGIELSPPDEQGRIYPMTENASTVVDCLRYFCSSLGVKILCDTTAVRLISKDNLYYVTLSNGEILCADSVVLACGSGSSATMPKLDYLIDNRMLTPTSPSLTPIKLVSPYKILNGLRAKVNVILNKDGAPIAIEKGEILFKEYGVTGICIFNLSAIIARNKSQNINGKYSLSIDLLPMFSVQQLQTLLSIRKDRGYNLQNIFLGLLSNKLAECVIDRAKVDMLNKLDIIQLVSTAKNFAFDVVGNLDFSMSQVTSGGVDDKYLTDKLSLPNGVSVIGELLNIDGLCGGYNLYIAIASAIMVGEQ